MENLFLISGGSASGKSAYAESLAVGLWNEKKAAGYPDAKMIYAATMRIYGDEGREKVARHRSLRAGKGFFTVEQQVDIGSLQGAAGDIILIEDIANLLANEMYDRSEVMKDCAHRIAEGIFSLCGRGLSVVCVSCEVFSDGTLYDHDTQEYIRNLGALHQLLAQRAKLVAELVCGIPVIYGDGYLENDRK